MKWELTLICLASMVAGICGAEAVTRSSAVWGILSMLCICGILGLIAELGD